MKHTLFLSLLATFPILYQAQNHSLDLDGANDYINCGNGSSVQITGDSLTLEAWIYADAWATNVWEGNIINKEQNSPDNGYMLRAGAGGKLNFNFGNGGWYDLTSSGSVLTLNTWHHVAGVYDGTYMKIYVDGTVTDSMAASGNIGNAAGKNLTLGSWSSVGRYFDGQIDEVRIWSTARTKAELLANMHTEICNSEAGLAAYYKFNQGIASGSNATVKTLVDATSNGNNGTLTNFTLNGSSSNWLTSPTIISQVYQPADAPALTTSLPAICVGSPDSSVINISGNLNDAQAWSIRQLSCSGSLAGTTTGNQLAVKPPTTRTYYVRGTGGCADAGPCIGISVTVAPPPDLSFVVTDEAHGNDGAIDLTVVGTSPFLYDWNIDGVGDWDDSEDLAGLTGGTYTVIVRDSNLCQDTAWTILKASTTIGIPSTGASVYQLYPNPASEVLYFDLKKAGTPVTQIELISIVGDVVRRFVSAAPGKITKLDLNSPEAGIYFLKFEWEGRSVIERIIVK